MSELSKWDGHSEVKPEEEAEYLKDLCAYLREQQTLSEPTKNEDGVMTCEVVPDEMAAHAADVIQELWGRLEEQYKEGILKGIEIKEGEYEYEQEILKGCHPREG